MPGSRQPQRIPGDSCTRGEPGKPRAGTQPPESRPICKEVVLFSEWPARLTQLCSPSPGEQPELGSPPLCHSLSPGLSPASPILSWSGKEKLRGCLNGGCLAPHVHNPGERSPAPIHLLLNTSASLVPATTRHTAVPELLPACSFWAEAAWLGDSLPGPGPPADRSECSQSWKAGKGRYDPGARRAPQSGDKGLRALDGWVESP